VAHAAPEEEDAWERMEMDQTSFLLKMVCSSAHEPTCGNGVEASGQRFLTRRFDMEAVHAHILSNLQVIYQQTDGPLV
jgi:hypothetical protein